MENEPLEICFAKILLNWYEQNKRELPWRNTTDAYTIWISEIILQQTRVEQGLDYFLRFVKRFPDVKTLAKTDEIEVLKYWQGLGYYSRARNLHFAAKQIMNDFGGKFPEEYKNIRSLKGIGDYTAAAICSFAHNKPYAAIDGNAYRVLSRFFGICTPIDTPKAKKEFTELANFVLDKKHPGKFNQAMMDFGATFCTPASPNCNECPFAEKCFAYTNNKVDSLPQKSKKINSKNRYFNYFYIRNNGKTYLHKRTSNDIWKNLYEFPLIETKSEASLNEILGKDFLKEIDFSKCRITESFTKKHVLTHQNIFAKFYIIDFFEHESKILSNFIELNESEIGDYPISRLSEIFIEKLYN